MSNRLEWEKLLSIKRLGAKNHKTLNISDQRTQFQRDYDRLIFSSPFRRLQNKTQVFPLPGSVFVHNRLTHSLEVASVGRSLGSQIGHFIKYDLKESSSPLVNEIGSAVSAACLAHDLGNPPFGHSGENAISKFFKRGKGTKYQSLMSNEEWHDIIKFDGNANAFRLLSHGFNGRRDGGFALTYTTLASVVKYPYEAHLSAKQKFGFFQSEKNIFLEVAEELGLKRDRSVDGLKYFRHPLVYLVEAADDICYQIIDIEDAFKLRILDFKRAEELLLAFFSDLPSRTESYIKAKRSITDKNELIGILRALVIGLLVEECLSVFKKNYETIMHSKYKGSLIDQISDKPLEALNSIRAFSSEYIYEDKKVVEIEMAGYRILGELLEEYTEAMFNNDTYSHKMISMMPTQYHVDKDSSPYTKLISVIDFVTGMTDIYALDLFRKIKGISLPKID